MKLFAAFIRLANNIDQNVKKNTTIQNGSVGQTLQALIQTNEQSLYLGDLETLHKKILSFRKTYSSNTKLLKLLNLISIESVFIFLIA